MTWNKQIDQINTENYDVIFCSVHLNECRLSIGKLTRGLSRNCVARTIGVAVRWHHKYTQKGQGEIHNQFPESTLGFFRVTSLSHSPERVVNPIWLVYSASTQPVWWVCTIFDFIIILLIKHQSLARNEIQINENQIPNNLNSKCGI
jgi:hypothetical protein